MAKDKELFEENTPLESETELATEETTEVAEAEASLETAETAVEETVAAEAVAEETEAAAETAVETEEVFEGFAVAARAANAPPPAFKPPKKRKYKSIETLKSRYGLMFTLPWMIGFVLFFTWPLIQSIWYTFCDVTLSADGVATKFVGMENYDYFINRHPNYTGWLTEGLTSILYSLPIILLVSLVLALLLNQKFRGRLFFRALYFVPVIIATGVVVDLMFQTTSEELTSAGVSLGITDSMFSIEDVVGWLDMPDKVAEYVKLIINNIFDLLWSCGIQTVLFIAGLQSIPRSLYEASKVEGATKWEEFWFITFPMLGSVTLLVSVFTMVDIFTSENNTVVKQAYTLMDNGVFDNSSTMLWIYFVVIGAVMGLLLFCYNRFLLKRWQ